MDSVRGAAAWLQSVLAGAARILEDWWAWYWDWNFRWHLLAGVAFFVCAAVFGPKLVRRYQLGRTYRKGWITYLVSVELRRRRPRSVRLLLSEWGQTLQDPQASTFVVMFAAVALSYLLQYLVGLIPLCALTARETSSFESILGGLLQAHVTVAGVALPVLIFVIERAREEEETRLPASEVVMRESWIVPLTIFALLTSIKIGWDYVGFGTTTPAVLTDITMFSLTVLFTARAVFLTLKLSFSRRVLKEKGLDLIRRKAAMSAERSVRIRLADNMLARVAGELRIGFWLFGVDREARSRFHVVEATRRGTLVNVNVVAMKEFMEALRFKPTVREAGAVGQEQAAAGAEAEAQPEWPRRELERVFLVRRIGEEVTEKAGALILIDKGSVESFEAIDRANWVRRMFRLEE